MELTVPKEQLFVKSTIYYVTSDSEPGEIHIVVRNQETMFCDCRDFMIRHLPLFGTHNFSLCKHGRFVQDSLYPKPNPKKFAVFYLVNGGWGRSTDVPGVFNSIGEAQAALNSYLRARGEPAYVVDREVREL